jgi:hypothetical protein
MIWRPPAMLGLFLISLTSTGVVWLLTISLIIVVAGLALADEIGDHHGR